MLKVATHAVGDRTVRTVLDAYEKALAAHSDTSTRAAACASSATPTAVEHCTPGG